MLAGHVNAACLIACGTTTTLANFSHFMRIICLEIRQNLEQKVVLFPQCYQI